MSKLNITINVSRFFCQSVESGYRPFIGEKIKTVMDNIFHCIKNNEDFQFTLAHLKGSVKDHVPEDICFQDTIADIMAKPWYKDRKKSMLWRSSSYRSCCINIDDLSDHLLNTIFCNFTREKEVVAGNVDVKRFDWDVLKFMDTSKTSHSWKFMMNI